MALTPEVTLSKKVLDLTTLRHQLVVNNLANSNTPSYKRTDLSFTETLATMAERAGSVERNTPPDLLISDLADLSKGKHLAFFKGNTSGDMGVDFAKSSLLFDYGWFSGLGEEFSVTGKEKNLSREDIINNTEPIVIKTKDPERLDGNNVNVDIEISEMIKNTSYYNMLTSIVSGDFRVYRTIVTAR